MKRFPLLLFTLLFSSSLYAFHYIPELDGEGGLFFVTGDDAVFGILILIVCIATVFICYKVVELINKNGESEGIKSTVSNILSVIGGIAAIAIIGLSFALWWIILILFAIYIIGLAIYQKITEKKSNNTEPKVPATEVETSITPQIEQSKEISLYNKQGFTDKKIENKETIFIQDWSLLSFAKKFGKMQVGSFIHNNKKFKACVFTDTNGNRVFAKFFSELGELSPQEIKDRKNELYIGKTKKGNYILYSKSNKGWIIEETGYILEETEKGLKKYPYKTSITSLSNFMSKYGSISIEEFVNNVTGENDKVCMFTDTQEHKTFVSVSPYMGNLTLEEIKRQKENLCIYWEMEGCYFLCSNDIIEYRRNTRDEFAYYSSEHDCESLLTELNVKHNFDLFTFSFEE